MKMRKQGYPFYWDGFALAVAWVIVWAGGWTLYSGLVLAEEGADAGWQGEKETQGASA
jgi:hypothetical protein